MIERELWGGLLAMSICFNLLSFGVCIWAWSSLDIKQKNGKKSEFQKRAWTYLHIVILTSITIGFVISVMNSSIIIGKLAQ